MKYQEQHTQGDKMGNNRDIVINDKTKVPLFTMIACIGVVVAAALWINNSMKDNTSELKDIKRDLSDIKQEMTKRLSHDTMDNWIIRLKYENPSIKVPELH